MAEADRLVAKIGSVFALKEGRCQRIRGISDNAYAMNIRCKESKRSVDQVLVGTSKRDPRIALLGSTDSIKNRRGVRFQHD